ncbi:MAG: hypothetical protein ACYC0P_02755 [Thiobacillus sp.]
MKRAPTDYTLEEFAKKVHLPETTIKTFGPPDYTVHKDGKWHWFYRQESVQDVINAQAEGIRSAWGYLPARKPQEGGQ